MSLSLVVVSAASSGVAPAAAQPAGTRISWQGNSWFLQGANLPWLNWGCDFGCNGNGGVSSPEVASTLQSKFQDAQASGVHVIRWWVFEGDPSAAQILRDGNGAPKQVNAAVFADFDAALAMAQTYDVYFDFVLFSAPTAVPRTWVTDTAQRTQLAGALGALFAHYSDNPHVISWEVFNEPEWDINQNKIDAGSIQATVRAIADSVHANSHAYVTVGSAYLSGLPLVVGQHLDYYQAHWYDPMTDANCARCTDYASVQRQYGLDAPLVIGEMYAPASADAAERLSDLYAAGYAGAWPWSLLPDRTNDHFSVGMAAERAFSQQHQDAGPSATSLQSSVPPAAATPVAVPAFSVGPRFLADFADLHALIGDLMGDPLENEHSPPGGCDTQQLTTTGLAYWRCATGTVAFVAFPDGMHHWALVHGAVVQWDGLSADPPPPGQDPTASGA